jgi:molecular chaperone GrpE
MTNEQDSSKWEDIANNQSDEVESEIELNVDPASSGLEHPDYEALQKKLTESESKTHENWEKAVRATAEVENVRRRAKLDVESAHKYGSEKFINSLLPVIDSLEQALQGVSEPVSDELKTMQEGIELTLKLFVDSLNKANVKQLNPVGETFDPQKHEAMSMQDAPDEVPGSVLMVFQKGYTLNERVIRPARVVVVKGKPASVDTKA